MDHGIPSSSRLSLKSHLQLRLSLQFMSELRMCAACVRLTMSLVDYVMCNIA